MPITVKLSVVAKSHLTPYPHFKLLGRNEKLHGLESFLGGLEMKPCFSGWTVSNFLSGSYTSRFPRDSSMVAFKKKRLPHTMEGLTFGSYVTLIRNRAFGNFHFTVVPL